MTLKNANVKVDEDALEEVAAALGVSLESETVEGAVDEMRSYFADRLRDVPKDDWIECTRCGEFADDDERIERCPFCGDEGEEATADLEDLEPEDAPEPEEPPSVDLDEPEVAAKPAKRDRVKKAGKKAATGTALAKVKRSDLSVEEAFEVEDGRVRKSQEDMVANSYEMGLGFRNIHEGELWKSKGFKTFKQYVASTGVKLRVVYYLMEMVEKFDCETFVAVGSEKLKIIAGVPKEHQEDLIEKAEAGASKRDILKEAKELRGGDGDREAPEKEETARTKARTKPAKETADRETPAKEGQIVLLGKVGGRPKRTSWLDRKTREEVAEWNPETFAEIPISEDVVLFISKEMSGKAETGLVYTFRRVEKAAASSKANGAAAKKEPSKKAAPKKARGTEKKAASRASKAARK